MTTAVSDTTSHTKLDTINSTLIYGNLTVVDSATRTKLDTVNSNLNIVNTNLGTLEDDVETTNSKLDTVNTNITSNLQATQPRAIFGNYSGSNIQLSATQSGYLNVDTGLNLTSIEEKLTDIDNKLNNIKSDIALMEGYILGLRDYQFRLSPFYQRGKGNCWSIEHAIITAGNDITYIYNPPGSGKTYFVYHISVALGYNDGDRGSMRWGIGSNFKTFTNEEAKPIKNLKSRIANVSDKTRYAKRTNSELETFNSYDNLGYYRFRTTNTNTLLIDYQEEMIEINEGYAFYLRCEDFGDSSPYFNYNYRWMEIDTDDLPSDWTV
jgi:hypothetical protein